MKLLLKTSLMTTLLTCWISVSAQEPEPPEFTLEVIEVINKADGECGAAGDRNGADGQICFDLYMTLNEDEDPGYTLEGYNIATVYDSPQIMDYLSDVACAIERGNETDGNTVGRYRFAGVNGPFDLEPGTPYLIHNICYQFRDGASMSDFNLVFAEEFITGINTTITFRNPARLPVTAVNPGTEEVVLPVELLDFSAVLENGNGVLKWSTATETDNDRFEVERSLDGITFEKIGEVEGAGTISTTQHYSYVDENIGSLGSPQVYYRLKQVDFDGTFEYSDIDVILIDKSTEYSLYPNPAFSNKDVNIVGPAIKTVAIYSVSGQFVKNYEFDKPQNIVTVPSADLAMGLYIAIINQSIEKRFIVGE